MQQRKGMGEMDGYMEGSSDPVGRRTYFWTRSLVACKTRDPGRDRRADKEVDRWRGEAEGDCSAMNYCMTLSEM